MSESTEERMEFSQEPTTSSTTGPSTSSLTDVFSKLQVGLSNLFFSLSSTPAQTQPVVSSTTATTNSTEPKAESEAMEEDEQQELANALAMLPSDIPTVEALAKSLEQFEKRIEKHGANLNKLDQTFNGLKVLVHDKTKGNIKLRKKMEKLKRRMDLVKARCCVCLESTSDASNGLPLKSTPCGHLYCTACLDRLTTASGIVRCAVCQKRYRAVQCHRIYLV